MVVILWFFFFFFQAEDGIRDRTVTGVQTCALPIFSPVLSAGKPLHAWLDSTGLTVAEAARIQPQYGGTCLCPSGDVPSGATAARATRSEERRGGKEGGARRGPGPHQENACRVQVGG